MEYKKLLEKFKNLKEDLKSFFSKFRFWVKAGRDYTLPLSVLPCLIGFILALKVHGHNYFLGILALIGVVFVHLGVNLLDDYFDFKSGEVENRLKLQAGGIRTMMGKCGYLLKKEATLEDTFKASSIFCIIAIILGLIIAFQRGFLIIVIAGIAGILGYFYSAEPFKFSCKGFGEIVVGILFGPLIIIGTYLCITGKLTIPVIFISMPIGILIANVAHVHSIMDYESDKKAGKKTLCRLAGSPCNGYIVMILALFLSYLCIAYGIANGIFSHAYWLTYLTIPMSVELIKSMGKYIEHPEFVPKRKAWLGFMENWESIQKIGMDWFFVRWYLSRNILIAFSILVCIAALF